MQLLTASAIPIKGWCFFPYPIESDLLGLNIRQSFYAVDYMTTSSDIISVSVTCVYTIANCTCLAHLSTINFVGRQLIVKNILLSSCVLLILILSLLRRNRYDVSINYCIFYWLSRFSKLFCRIATLKNLVLFYCYLNLINILYVILLLVCN